MPRNEKQNAEIRSGKRKLIKDHALRLFSSNSYHSVTIGMIAQSAGISKGLIYNYFKSKEDLLIHIMEDSMEDILDEIDPNHDGILEHHELMNFIEAVFETVGTKREFWRLFYGLALQQDVMTIIEKKMNEWLQPYYILLFSYFEKRGYEKPMAEAVFFTSMMDGLVFNYLADTQAYPLQDIIEKVKKMYDK